MTVYAPGMSGVQFSAYVPLASLVVVPMVLKLLFASMTLRVTVTPVVFAGAGCCWYTYSIQWLWLASDTAGRPLGKFFATADCDAPAETSMTVPVMVIGVSVVTPICGALTVVELGP